MRFINLHQHTHFSNAITIPECINTHNEYIEYAKNNGIDTICFTEHGNIFSWVKKKMDANAAGLKFVHGCEVYVTDQLEEKVKDNFHLVLLARNHEGVKELNRLVSKGFTGRGTANKEDNHFYYVPRVSFNELTETSENILILTACLASPLWQHYKNNNKVELEKWLKFLSNNKNRVWLEVQPHNNKEQIIYNKLLLEWAELFDMNIVATNDVHALSKEDDRVRNILMKSKGIRFEDGEEHNGIECWVKSYDEMVSSFEMQGVLSEEQIKESLENTIKIANMVEDFEFDYSFKYPQIFDDPDKGFKELILEGYKNKKINLLDKPTQKIYQDRINHELKIYHKMDAVNFMLLMEYVIGGANRNNIYFGYGRGSVNGSLIAYLIDITSIDPIKEKLNFERFMNPDRISLSDIDSDVSGVSFDGQSDRDWVVNFLMNNDKFNCSAIITYNTLGLKGAIKDMGRALNYPPLEMNNITAQIEADGSYPYMLEEGYEELFKLAKRVVGVVTSIGRHAGGFIVTKKDIVSELGVVEVDKSDSLVSSVAMKEVDKLNYIKLDILGLDNVALINNTCKLAGLDRANPQSEYIDFNDKNVMEDLRESTIGIFQFEGQRAQKLVKDMFSEEVLDKLRKTKVDMNPVRLLALLSAAMRPGAASIIDDIVSGNIADNGHEALDELLSESLNYLIYQEQQIAFLVEMCGRSNSGADLIRRAIGKKDPKTLEEEVPKIKNEFIETMITKYGDSYEHAASIADKFMKIFQDAANYSFSKNHAVPYAYISYISAWLRWYYPLEFLTSAFIVFKDDLAKVGQLTKYAEYRGINIKPVKFGYAKGDYFFNRETNTIYEGVGTIKGNNSDTGNGLFELSQREDIKNETSFINFLMRIKDNREVGYNGKNMSLIEVFNSYTESEIKDIDKALKKDEATISEEINPFLIDKTKILSLIRLNYFERFGNAKYLEDLYIEFNSTYKPKNKTLAGKYKKYKQLKELEESLPNEPNSIYTHCEYELDYLGRCTIKDDRVQSKYLFVTNIINVGKTRTTAKLHNINKGKTIEAKFGAKVYRNIQFKEKDLIEVITSEVKPKSVKVGGEWVKHPTDKELWIKEFRMIRKGTDNDK